MRWNLGRIDSFVDWILVTSCENQQQVGACPGVEPGTSRTLGEINRSPFPALFTSINSYLIHFPFPIDVYHKMPPIWHSSTTFWKISLLSFGQVKNLSPFQGRGKDGAVVRALAASRRCGLSSNPGVDAMCGLVQSLLLVLYFAPRGFSSGTPVFPSP